MPFFHLVMAIAALFQVCGLGGERLCVPVQETGDAE